MTRELRQWEALEAEALVREFHDLAQTKTEFSPKRFWDTIYNMELRDALFFRAMVVDRQVVGVLIGTIAPQMMTETTVAQEVMWFVREDHRGSADSVRLLRDFEDWAKKRGADGIIMASFAAVGDEKLNEFYARRGYDRLETHFLKYL